MGHAGHAKTLRAGLAHRGAPEIVRRERRARKRRRHAVAAQIGRRLREIARALGGGQDQRDAAVIDQAIVEQVQRLADEARGVIVGERERLAHHGRRIERRVIAERLRHGAELVRRRAVELHVAARHQRVERAGRGHAIGKPVAGAAAAIGVAGAAIAVPGRAAVVAVDQRDGRGEPVADQRRRGLDVDAGEAALPGRDVHVVRADAGDLAEALIVGDAIDDQPVDVLEDEARRRQARSSAPTGRAHRRRTRATARSACVRHRRSPLHRSCRQHSTIPVSCPEPFAHSPFDGESGRGSEPVEAGGIVDQDLPAHRGVRRPHGELVEQRAVVNRDRRRDFRRRPAVAGMRPVVPHTMRSSFAAISACAVAEPADAVERSGRRRTGSLSHHEKSLPSPNTWVWQSQAPAGMQPEPTGL